MNSKIRFLNLKKQRNGCYSRRKRVAFRKSGKSATNRCFKMLQELKPHDDTLRIDFANFVISKISEDDTWMQRILRKDEVHFTISDSVNAHNYRVRATNVLNVRNPLHSDYLTVWCGMICDFLMGPYFFQTPTPSGPKCGSFSGTTTMRC